ncbi:MULTISPECIES: hypothetical protein [Gulbenkiania]|uniref:DUF4376 domain-containing protein n=1 Tax=Gulbenkiania indica TaxID=375574 RepID=A0A0K6GUB6_9NEIS|nr:MULTISPECIES: hypothetical protein [Gulbenkiania]CUA82082.1 hypothetical protein Ga0061063_0937 [Gulbenkiania indica]
MWIKDGKKIFDTGFTHQDVTYPPGWIALASDEERAAVGISYRPDPARPDPRLGTVEEKEDGSYTLTPYPLGQVIAQQIERIDARAEAIYRRWTRFEAEYRARAAAAQAFKDAGYKGDPGIYVTSFATPTGITLRAATDLILSQALALQVAQDRLAGLRMRKYEVARLTAAEEALAVTDAICAEMDTVEREID